MSLLRLQADIFFKCVLDTCHDQVIIVIFLCVFFFPKKERYFEFPVCINCQSNKRRLTSQNGVFTA